MKHYENLIDRLRSATKLPMLQALCNEAADEIEEISKELTTCRNELCLRCGEYQQRHLGACDGCRWLK